MVLSLDRWGLRLSAEMSYLWDIQLVLERTASWGPIPHIWYQSVSEAQ